VFRNEAWLLPILATDYRPHDLEALGTAKSRHSELGPGLNPRSISSAYLEVVCSSFETRRVTDVELSIAI